VLALLASAVAGPVASGNPVLLVGVVALVYAPRVGRIARSAAQNVAAQDYVLIARLRGERVRDVVRREILPNCSGPLLVEFALRAGYAPVLIGSLGFLGFGVRAPLHSTEHGLSIRCHLSLAELTKIGRPPGKGNSRVTDYTKAGHAL